MVLANHAKPPKDVLRRNSVWALFVALIPFYRGWETLVALQDQPLYAKFRRRIHVMTAILLALAAVTFFVTYGTVLPIP